MRKMAAITLKELSALFRSPIAYITLIITISVFNVFFFMIIDQNREATLRDIFKLIEFMLVFIIPLLTMNVFAQEKRSGTIEFLATSPVTSDAIVLGKYMGSLIFFTILLSFTGIYYGIIRAFASIDRAASAVGYLGLFLEGAFFIAIGLLTSSWTKNQIIAAASSYMILLSLYFSVALVKFFSGQAAVIVQYIGVWSHSQNLMAGILRLQDIVYFVSGILFCLLLMRLSINKQN